MLIEIITAVILSFYTIWMQFFSFEEQDDDGDEEEEYMYLQLLNVRHRNDQPCVRVENFIERTVPNFSAGQFQSHFRLSRTSFEWLLRKIGPNLCKEEGNLPGGRPTIDVEKQLLVVIWLLATPDSFRSIGLTFNMGKSSIFYSFLRVIKALNRIAPEIIKWPDAAKRAVISHNMAQLGRLNGVVGVVDGVYIQIKAPRDDANIYINRKCFYAMTLQAICDNERGFMDCFCGYPSSVADVRIFRNSDIYQNIIENVNSYFNEREFIIGDKAYPLYKWCIPPYINRGNITQVQINFNTFHAKTRQVIERSFALLIGRFRRLSNLDMNRTDLIPATIIACTVLHNICLENDDPDILHLYEAEGHPLVQGEDQHELEHIDLDQRCLIFAAERSQLRNNIARHLFQFRE